MPEESIEIGGWKLTPDELRQLLLNANPFMLAEAIASVRLDQESDVRTVALPPAEESR